MFDINKFKARTDPPLRNNKFTFQLATVPRALATDATNRGLIEKMMFYCEAVDVPGTRLMTDEIRRYGYGVVEKHPYSAFFDDCRVTFRDDQSGSVVKFMKEWQAATFNYDYNFEFGQANADDHNRTRVYEVAYRLDYVADCLITLHSDDGGVAHQIRLRDAFPSMIADTPLGWAMTNDYYRLPVSFSFTDFSQRSS